MNRRQCFDTLRGLRCQHEPHEDGIHRHGSVTWGARDVPRPLWVRMAEAHTLRARELVR